MIVIKVHICFYKSNLFV